jgi:[ribosomal protein S5]-alanine N-acetyltransferase
VLDPDAVIETERLELPLLSLEQLDSLAAGEWSPTADALNASISEEWARGVRRIAAIRAQQVRERPSDAPWLLRAILLRSGFGPRRAIGSLNFHAGPDESGRVEIGYGLTPDARGQGYAIEAVRAAFGWATRVHGIHRFRASVSPDNERSMNLIRKLGFRQTGDQWDEEDGLELVFELELPAEQRPAEQPPAERPPAV